MKVSTTAERLKQIMNERHLKQTDILRLSEPHCKKLGVKINKNDLSQYVNGKVVPGQFKLSILATTLNVSETWLMGYDVPRDSIGCVSYDSVAYKVKVLLHYRDISFYNLAKQLNISELELKEYLLKCNEHNADDFTLKKIAEILEVAVSDFFEFNTYTEDDSTNYISFLEDKIQKKLPLTKRESEIMVAYYNSEDGFDIYPDNIIPLPKMKKVPLLGTIACGEPILAEENIEDYINMPEKTKGTFALRCKGDSMINARIFDGDIVFIREQPDVESGEIAAVLIDNEATLKRVYKYENRIELRPENPTHKVYNYEGEEINKIRIIGKAVGFYSSVI